MRRPLRLPVLLLALGLAALAGLAWALRDSFVRVPQEVETGFQGEALTNPTLLLEKVLRAEGRVVLRKGGPLLAQELPEGGVLLLLRVDQPLSPGEVGVLLDWAARGGHLLTDGSAAPFNDERGLAALHRALDTSLDNALGAGPEAQVERKTLEQDTFPGEAAPYRIRRSARWRLKPSHPEAWDLRLGAKAGDVLLSRPWGRGRLTLTPDLNFVYGQHLVTYEHADYLDRLLALHPASGTVAVWSQPVAQPLFAWRWTPARPALLGLLLLASACLWAGGSRFGPALPPPSPLRRSLLEHLRACGAFVWGRGGQAHLVARTREALLTRAHRLNPAFGAWDLGERAHWLAGSTGGPEDAIAAALDDRPGRPPQLLAQDLVLLEQLRQRLLALPKDRP